MTTQTKHHHWSAIEEKGAYLGMSTIFGIYKLFGRKVFSFILYFVTVYFFIINKSARKASLDFLSRVAAQKQATAPKLRHAFYHFISFGESLLDKLAAWTGDIKVDDIIYENYELFTEARKKEIGSVLISSHLGNIEICRALGTLHKNIKMNIVIHTKNARNFNRLMQKANPNSHVSLIQSTEINPATIVSLQQKINQGEFVIILGDRLPVGQSRHYSKVSFLGSPAPFPQGPFILASLLQCPTLLIFCLKTEKKYKLIFEPFENKINLPREQREEILTKLISRYANRLEAHCLAFPYQWFNFFDFWHQTSNQN